MRSTDCAIIGHIYVWFNYILVGWWEGGRVVIELNPDFVIIIIIIIILHTYNILMWVRYTHSPYDELMVSAVIWPGGSLLADGVTQARHAWKPGGFFWGPVRTLTSVVLSSDEPGGFDGASSGELSAASSRLSEYIGISSVCKTKPQRRHYNGCDCNAIDRGGQGLHNRLVRRVNILWG